jgi:hypothetical protein
MATRLRRFVRRALAGALVAGVACTVSARAADDPPRYDVPAHFTRCAHATAWNGFFKWASVHRTSCRYAANFMRAYARAVPDDGTMPRRVRGFACSIRYWKNEDGDVYASRHRCVRRRVIVRFYGMV